MSPEKSFVAIGLGLMALAMFGENAAMVSLTFGVVFAVIGLTALIWREPR